MLERVACHAMRWRGLRECCPKSGIADGARTVAFSIIVGSAACTDSEPLAPEPPNLPPVLSPTLEARSAAGGETTISDVTSHAFSTPAPNLSGVRLDLHLDGDLAFAEQFVRAPSEINPGLGPVFNETSCEGCHVADGRTRGAFLMRLSLPGADGVGGPLPVPGFGTQLQDESVFGVSPEGRIDTRWVESVVELDDGTQYSLREPIQAVHDPYAPLPGGVLTSVRMPRPVFGLGLLEAIPESRLWELADEGDADGDGISGRVNRVFDVTAQRTRAGRFGWKASQPTLLQQTAAAYLSDIGVTSSVFPSEAFAGQPQDDLMDDDPEITDETLEAAVFYVQTLAVPAPRDAPEMAEGQELFGELGCADCHVPSHVTGVLPGVPEVSGQVIFPYTDLLLHDMGPGLADGRPDFEASGSEWRTPPLWGLGLSSRVTGHTDFLHDGRARDVVEAILWHGGEAESARAAFSALSASSRTALVAFLQSL